MSDSLWTPKESAERVRPDVVARMTSLSVRKVQELSAAGKIPSAAKLGGVWTYDPVIVRQWIKRAERNAWQPRSEPVAYTSAAKRGGDAAKLPATSIEALYAQVIGVKPRGAIKRGVQNSSARR